MPFSASHSVMAFFASSTLMPSRKPLFTITPVAQSVKASFVHIAALDDLDDGQTEFFRELPVAARRGRARP